MSATSAVEAGPTRGNTFDFLRLIAALSVLVHHSVAHLDTNFLWHSEDNDYWFHGGVTLFFVLSGMMVYKSAERCHRDGRPWWDFYLNRALRIMPAMYAYFLALVIILLAIGVLSLSDLGSTQFIAFGLSNLFLVPVYHPGIFADFGIGVINGSLWTIPVEVSFYVVVPVLVIIAARYGWRKMMLITAAAAVSSVVVYALMGGSGSESLVRKLFGITFAPHLFAFGLGIFWARMWPRVRHSGWIALACLVVHFLLFYIPGSGVWSTLVSGALSAVPLSYAVMWFGYNGPKFLWGIGKVIGDLSFSTYIWHMIVVNTLIMYGARTWAVDGTVLVLLVALISMGISASSWWFIEKPALRLKRYTSVRSVPLETAANRQG